MSNHPTTITTQELTPELWPALERFFGTEECSDCWCMNHRIPPTESLVGEPARLALSKSVRERRAHGVLAFDGERPVGWCAFDRIADLPGLDCGFSVAPQDRDKIDKFYTRMTKLLEPAK